MKMTDTSDSHYLGNRYHSIVLFILFLLHFSIGIYIKKISLISDNYIISQVIVFFDERINVYLSKDKLTVFLTGFLASSLFILLSHMFTRSISLKKEISIINLVIRYFFGTACFVFFCYLSLGNFVIAESNLENIFSSNTYIFVWAVSWLYAFIFLKVFI